MWVFITCCRLSSSKEIIFLQCKCIDNINNTVIFIISFLPYLLSKARSGPKNSTDLSKYKSININKQIKKGETRRIHPKLDLKMIYRWIWIRLNCLFIGSIVTNANTRPPINNISVFEAPDTPLTSSYASCKPMIPKCQLWSNPMLLFYVLEKWNRIGYALVNNLL